jgi:hypothetical protein
MPSVTIDPSTSDILDYADAAGRSSSIHFPAGAVTETTTLVYTPVGTATAPAGYAFAGLAFSLEAYRGSAWLPGFAFETSITVTVQYTDTDVAGLDESSLELWYWNGSQWSADGITILERDATANRLTASVAHLSKFALFGEAHQVYLPMVQRN